MSTNEELPDVLRDLPGINSISTAVSSRHSVRSLCVSWSSSLIDFSSRTSNSWCFFSMKLSFCFKVITSNSSWEKIKSTGDRIGSKLLEYHSRSLSDSSDVRIHARLPSTVVRAWWYLLSSSFWSDLGRTKAKLCRSTPVFSRRTRENCSTLWFRFDSCSWLNPSCLIHWFVHRSIIDDSIGRVSVIDLSRKELLQCITEEKENTFDWIHLVSLA